MLTWWDAEHANLVAAVRQADQHDSPRACLLAHTLMYFFKLRGHLEDWIATNEIAVAAAERAEEPGVRTQLTYELGMPYFVLRQFETALKYQGRARSFSKQQATGTASRQS